jgi:hypothetical protein
MTPSEVIDRARLEGKSIRQIIDEDPANAKLPNDDRALLAKIVVANALLTLYDAGATPEQMREVMRIK